MPREVALITTTINVPQALALMQATLPPLSIYVACDKKTPNEAYTYMEELRRQLKPKGITLDWVMEGTHTQHGKQSAPYRCSELIGWNTIQRRNIALLEAMKRKPRTVISVDDDNIPLRPEIYSSLFNTLVHLPFSGLCAHASEWFDPGNLLAPRARHRGFPISIPSTMAFCPVAKARVGVAAGMCLGDPDISAVDRISQGPIVTSITEMARGGGVVVPPTMWTVFNSQNTAIDAELAPAWFMLPGVGRYDDIYASLIVQRVMQEREQHVHFGEPFVWQERNTHNLVRDLRDEIDGMDHVVDFARFLNGVDLDPDRSVLDNVRVIWKAIQQKRVSWLPLDTCAAALAFLDDMEQVMAL